MRTPCTLYITPENRKMTIPGFALPAQITCPGMTPLCRRYCYARKAERLYRQVLPSRIRNLAATKHPRFVRIMSALIEASGTSKFRIHEGGDFYSQAYLNRWFQICTNLPDVSFLAFTKSHALNYAHKPDNLQIIWSIWPDTPSEALALPGPKAFTGVCTGMPHATPQCPGRCDNCMRCWNSQAGVHFRRH
jgi:hypothetical protein